MSVDTPHTWAPDLRLPVRSTLQEFVSHDRELTLRISLRSGQESQVEVNDRVVAETQGFPRAAALAELYTRKDEIVLTDERLGPIGRFGVRPCRAKGVCELRRLLGSVQTDDVAAHARRAHGT